jgi:hypothetical protein
MNLDLEKEKRTAERTVPSRNARNKSYLEHAYGNFTLDEVSS